MADTLTGKVIKITDGDTVHVLQNNYVKEKIRFAGIDAPERKQPHGNKAKQYLASLVGNKLVTVEYTKRDRYKRIVFTISPFTLLSFASRYAYWQYDKEDSKC